MTYSNIHTINKSFPPFTYRKVNLIKIYHTFKVIGRFLQINSRRISRRKVVDSPMQ